MGDENRTIPWLYADLVRNKALGYLTEHAAEHGIGVEQLPNAGIRLTVKQRYFWVRQAGNEERESGQYVEYTQLTLYDFLSATLSVYTGLPYWPLGVDSRQEPHFLPGGCLHGRATGC
jgi:hypothetical protein